MMRALFAGVSGLRNHLTRMDVIGNNIANVNTVAFKSSRVTFKEAFAQLLQGASKPPGDQGGINPIQVGLGMSIGSIDQNFTQGNLESTGQNTDLAIQGDGFFVCSDGRRRYFTRSGNFQLDADGRLVAPTNGFIVQGRTADAAGLLSSGARVADIVLPFGQKSPAKASSELTFSGNLDSRATPLGTILQTRGMFAIEQSTSDSDVNGLFAKPAVGTGRQILGLTQGAVVTVSDGTHNKTFTYVTDDTASGNTQFNSIQDLVDEINYFFSTGSAYAGSFDSMVAALSATGAITVTSQTPAAAARTVRSAVMNTAGPVPAVAGDLLAALTGVADGDILTISGTRADGSTVTLSHTVVGATDTVATLLAKLNNTTDGFGKTGTQTATATIAAGRIVVTDDANRFSQLALSITSNAAGVSDLDQHSLTVSVGGSPGAITVSLDSSNSTLDMALNAANSTLLAAANFSTTDAFSHVALGTDLLTDLRNEDGTNLGLAAGNITITGKVGGVQSTLTQAVVGTTYGTLLTAINSAFDLSNADRAAVNASTGALVINGDGGTARALTVVNISAGVAAFDAIFDSTPGNYSELQVATDSTHTASISVYDAMGNDHTISMTFTKDPTAVNRWTWQAEATEPAQVTSGYTGAVTFDALGRLEMFAYDGGATSFQFNPNTGATSPVDIELNPGALGSILGLSQFASASTAVASGQDGYPMGNLQDVSIDATGVITGFFTNGVSQTLAQISLASFNNPTGLLRRGDNMYEISGNSGNPVLGFAGTSNQSSITSGALESSNVDLAAEFTNMIIAQRGFQANSRVITTSDEMLQELVNLKR
jgi:flagellar hook protein FlgE